MLQFMKKRVATPKTKSKEELNIFWASVILALIIFLIWVTVLNGRGL